MLILVTGLPGSGKSTVARLVAERLGALVINSDTLRRELFPVARTYDSKETQAIIKETERRTRDLLSKGETVVLDALFTKQRPREEYRRLAGELGVPYVIVHVTASEDAIRQRLEARPHTGDASEATFEYYLNRRPHFEPIAGDHFRIDNSGELPELEENVESLLEKLRLV
jgi:uncharacterized protein